MEKKLTDEEIVNALVHCSSNCSCEYCYHNDEVGSGEIVCRARLMIKAIDLIHRLQDEIKGYKGIEKRAGELLDENLKFKQVYAEQKAEIERLTEELKNLDWYKMWHNKFKKEIEDLTLELETYRPTKLSGNGQCKCSICGGVSWTDWFSRYKGKTLCDKCLKEIMATEEKQAVKDTAKEILQEIFSLCKNAKEKLDYMYGSKKTSYGEGYKNSVAHFTEHILKIAREKGVEVE